MRIISTEMQLSVAVSQLVQLEPRFKAVIEAHGLPPLRRSNADLECLLRIVTDQLISLRAGEAIWRRIKAKLQPLEPAVILRHSEEDLRQLGLSGGKARTFLAVSNAAYSGLLDSQELSLLTDQKIVERLTSIPGIGPWTADIYLLTALGRVDAWPVGDLALQVAAADLFHLPGRPNKGAMYDIAETWRPWRSVAARLLWSHYRGLKSMPQLI
jgi:DNA-3-methyladenine glycosylase II